MSISKEYIKNIGGSVMVTGSDSTSSDIPGVSDDESNSRDATTGTVGVRKATNIVGVTHTITLRGTLVAGMQGSPNIGLADNIFTTLYNRSSTEYPDGAADVTSPREELAVTSDKQGFRAIMRMQDSLRGLFAEDGYLLEVHDQASEVVMKAVVRVTGIEFQEAEAGENWTSRCDYTITLETDSIFRAGAYSQGEDARQDGFDNLPKDIYGNEIFLREASENWAIEPQEEGSKARDLSGNSGTTGSSDFFNDHAYTFRVTHTVSAVGKRVYGGHEDHQTGEYSHPAGGSVTSEAWEEAKKWVQTKLGLTENKKKEILRGLGITGHNSIQLDNDAGTAISGANATVSEEKYKEYNRLRTENVDEYNGSYGVTETWVLSRDPYIEDFTVSMRTSNQAGTATISMDGSIRGLDNNSDTSKVGPDGSEEYTAAYQGEASSIFSSKDEGEGIDDQNIYNRTVNPKTVNALERFNRINFYQRSSFYLEYFLKQNMPREDTTTDFSKYIDGTDVKSLCLSPYIENGKKRAKLHPMPVSKNVTINPVAGVVNYQVEYDNTPRTTIYSDVSSSISCGDKVGYSSGSSSVTPDACTEENNIEPLDDKGAFKVAQSMEKVDRGGLSGGLSSKEGPRFDHDNSRTGPVGQIETEKAQLSGQRDTLKVNCEQQVTESACDVTPNEVTVDDESSRLYARSENINVQWTGGHQKYVMIPVLGRNYPVAQNVGNREPERLNVNIEAVMDIPSSSFWTIENKPTNIETEIIPEILTQCGALQVRLPISADVYGATSPYAEVSRMGYDLGIPASTAPAAKNFFVENDNESWNPRNGRYTRSITFVLKECVSKIQDSTSPGDNA